MVCGCSILWERYKVLAKIYSALFYSLTIWLYCWGKQYLYTFGNGVCAFHRLLINWILSYKKPKEKPVLSAIHKFKFHLYVNESGLFSLEVFNSHNLLRWMQWISFSTNTLDCQNVKKQKSIKWMQNYFCKSSTKPLSQDASKVKWKRHKFIFYLCDYYYRNVNYIIQT